MIQGLSGLVRWMDASKKNQGALGNAIIGRGT